MKFRTLLFALLLFVIPGCSKATHVTAPPAPADTTCVDHDDDEEDDDD